MTTFPQIPGVFTTPATTSSFVVGPHSLLVRNGITFNNRQALECYWVEEFGGFELPDVLVTATQNTEGDGELPDPGSFGGRTMTLTGYIQAGSYLRVLDMSRALLNSMISLVEKPMLITKQAASVFQMPDMTIDCRPTDRPLLDLKIQQSDLSGIFKRNFTITLRASNPLFVSPILQHASVIPTVITFLGRTYPRIYDMVYATPLDSFNNPIVGGALANLVTVHNDGNYKSSALLRFNGGMDGVRLDNFVTGQQMRLSAPVATGDYIQIDTKTGSITDSGGLDATRVWDTSSDWMTLVGKRDEFNGNNDLVLSVTTFDIAASLDVWWRDTNA